MRYNKLKVGRVRGVWKTWTTWVSSWAKPCLSQSLEPKCLHLRTLISGFLGLVILVRWALVTMVLSWSTQTGCRIHRAYVSLIGSGEGRHTTHFLTCVLLLSTSQTDSKQSSDVLSDISFDILADKSSDISSDKLTYLLIFFLTSFWHIFWHYFCEIFWHSFWHIFWHSFWHIFRHAFWHIFWHSFWHIKTKT